ncbi:MAG: hypothetical protein AAGG44_20885, partial [Planctomycetota bacterium]
MKFTSPTHGLDFITFFWIGWPTIMLAVAPTLLPMPFLSLIVLGLLSAVGIWAGIRPIGYVFALVNLAACVSLLLLVTGYF